MRCMFSRFTYSRLDVNLKPLLTKHRGESRRPSQTSVESDCRSDPTSPLAAQKMRPSMYKVQTKVSIFFSSYRTTTECYRLTLISSITPNPQSTAVESKTDPTNASEPSTVLPPLWLHLVLPNRLPIIDAYHQLSWLYILVKYLKSTYKSIADT